MSTADPHATVVHHTARTPDRLVDLHASCGNLAGRSGYYVRERGSCPRMVRIHVHGPFTRAKAEAVAALIEERYP